MRRFFVRLANFLQPGRADREMSREMQAHLDFLQDDFERRGLSPRESRLAALRAYGGVEQAKELHRSERTFVSLEQLRQDLFHAVRVLRHSPGFTVTVVLTLALGIGVNAALFSTYNAVALKPLPVADPGTVVRIERWFESGARGNVQYAFSIPEYQHLRANNQLFSNLVASSFLTRVNALIPAGYLSGQLVSTDYFSALGIPTEFGRTFLPQEGEGTAVLVLSHLAWQRYFFADPGILGRTVTLAGVPFTVIGVTRPQFTGTLDMPQVPDFWTPLAQQSRLVTGQDWRVEPTVFSVQLLARLKPGASRKQAEADTVVLLHNFDTGFTQRDRTRTVTLPATALFGNTEDPRFHALVAGVMFVVGLILLVACANIANMLLARGASRQREIGIRMALGAGRGRVIRQLLAESLVLGLLGGLAGLQVSIFTSGFLWRGIEQFINPAGSGITMQLDLSPDIRVLGYVLIVSVAAGLLFGLSPALRFTRTDFIGSLKDEGSVFHHRVSRSRLRSILIGAQVAVSMMLLVTAGFLARGLLRSRSAEPGFDTRHVFLLSGYFPHDPKLADRFRELSGVRGAAFGGQPLMGTWTPPISGTNGQGKAFSARTLASAVSQTYFETLGIPFVRGRDFTRSELDSNAQVAVISESTARQFWPANDPLEQNFSLDLNFDGQLSQFQVIGVVKDTRFANLTRPDPTHVYIPVNDQVRNNGMLIRLDGEAPRVLPGVRSTVEAFEGKQVPGVSLIRLEDGPVRMQRVMASASATFACILALLALVLAGVGIHGVMAYLVNRRVKEIGVRMALGASQPAVLRSVVFQGLRPVIIGLSIGLVLAAGVFWALHTSLAFPGSADLTYGVPYYDPPTFLGLTAFVLAVSALASAVPARRAIRVDPMVALRHE